jgi:hypothetical protein
MANIRSIAVFAIISLALTRASHLQAADRMRAGLWETTVTSGEKSSTRTSCITAELAAASNQSVQVVRESMEKSVAGNCKVTVKDFTAADNVITTQVVCGAISYVNTTTYKGDTVETVIVNVNAGVTKKTINVSRRVGACK